MKATIRLAFFAFLAAAAPLHAGNWMHRLPDNAYVATLSIPGSHDSGTGNGFPGITSIYGPFGDKYARTQDKSFEEQWEMGVRAFDLRPAVSDGYINVNHGIMPTKLRFDSAITFLRDKLRENPSEFAVIHLLHASAGDDNSSAYGSRLTELLGRDDLKDFFVPFKSTLTVKEMRGKILLISRDEYADTPIGGFFRNWTGELDWNAQTRGQIVGPTGAAAKCYMQDRAETYQEGMLEAKVQGVRQMLDFSTKHVTNTASDIVWVLNLASAYSKVSRLYIPLIVDEQVSTSDGYRDNAAHANAAIIDYLNDPANTPGPAGIVLADFVGMDWSGNYNTRGQELVDVLIANNFRYLKDMTQVGTGDATRRTPLDMTARIANPCFNSNITETGWEGDRFGAVNPRENAEHFNRTFNTHQVITGLPSGVYAVGVRAFFRPGEVDEAYTHFRNKDRTLRYARLYAVAGRDSLFIPILSPFSKSIVKAKGVGREIAMKNGALAYYIPDDMVAAEYYMHSLKAYESKLFVGITGNTLTIGVRKDRTAGLDWCVFDDFTLTYYGNQSDAYQYWITEMKRQRTNYSSVTVSTPYSERYDAAYDVVASNRTRAILTMRAVETASEAIAINAGLWAEYKQVASEAENLLKGQDIGQGAKDYLRTYYELVYLRNLAELTLTNEQLPHCISELQQRIDETRSGEWTDIAPLWEESEAQGPVRYYTIDGKPVGMPATGHGMYIMRTADGKAMKVIR